MRDHEEAPGRATGTGRGGTKRNKEYEDGAANLEELEARKSSATRRSLVPEGVQRTERARWQMCGTEVV